MTGPPDALSPPIRRGWQRWLLMAAVLSIAAVGCSTSQPSQPGSVDASTVPDDAPGQQTETSSDDDAAEASPGFDGTGGPSTSTAPNPIRIDQFGYRPGDPKVAVLADPEVGYDAEADYAPGPSLEVRRLTDDAVVFEAAPEPWSNGAVNEQSGDRGWWFDFSDLDAPGSYYIIDPATDARTGPFEIGVDVYHDVLKRALRMFWFNRANTAHPEDLAGPWADEAAYVGPNQDTEARNVDDQDNANTALDLSGGWFDAGDSNKYVTFASEPVHLLLSAYERNPEVFDDNLDIPESGNGIPDIIDEVRWEIDWLGRMQGEDGGVLTKVGVVDNGAPFPPSSSDLPRFYEGACSSATIAAAGMFAHAALVFNDVADLAGEAAQLEGRARSAWDWYQRNEKRDDCDAQIVRAGDADLSIDEQNDIAVVAAVYLFALTGDPTYEAAISDGYAETLPLRSGEFGNYGPDQSDALLFYRRLEIADDAIVADIDARIASLVADSPLFGFDGEADLYRAFMPDGSYHWGSNMVKANIGGANLAVEDPAGGNIAGGKTRALGHLHYFHGVNPLDLVYLTNMNDVGAERSAEALFHFWFGEDTPYDVGQGSEIGPAPGFVVGGPNWAYSGATAPPAGQPPMKSYRDWSAYGSEPTWEISEPAIYYQAAYVRLLAEVLGSR